MTISATVVVCNTDEVGWPRALLTPEGYALEIHGPEVEHAHTLIERIRDHADTRMLITHDSCIKK